MLRLFSRPERLDGPRLFQLHSTHPQNCRELRHLRQVYICARLHFIFVRDFTLYLSGNYFLQSAVR